MSGHTIKTFIDGGGCPCIAVTPWTFINQDTAGVDMLDADWVISSTIFMRIVPRKHTMLVPAGFGIGVNSKRHWGSVDPSMRTQTIPFDVTVVADRPGGFELVLVIVDDWKPELTEHTAFVPARFGVEVEDDDLDVAVLDEKECEEAEDGDLDVAVLILLNEKWLEEADESDFDVAVLVEKEPDDVDSCNVQASTLVELNCI
ncbi:hypothetical protein V8E54_002836 [Elaphomyces granulatus]